MHNRPLNETAVYSAETKITGYTYDFNGNLTSISKKASSDGDYNVSYANGEYYHKHNDFGCEGKE